MNIKPKTPGVHHVALRVSDVARARQFYTETLGFPISSSLQQVVLPLEFEVRRGTHHPATASTRHESVSTTSPLDVQTKASSTG
jgi:glyoxylase I family protein